jgi:hypothetical protein
LRAPQRRTRLERNEVIAQNPGEPRAYKEIGPGLLYLGRFAEALGRGIAVRRHDLASGTAERSPAAISIGSARPIEIALFISKRCLSLLFRNPICFFTSHNSNNHQMPTATFARQTVNKSSHSL